MENVTARELGEALKPYLERLQTLTKDVKERRSAEAEAIEIAAVNLSSAIDLLTE